MFVYNANANEDQSQALWQACLVGLQANLPQTQINLWLRAIEPLSLIQTVSVNNTQILLTCQTKQSQKINAIMSQFQAIVERQCHQLCGHAVEWSLLAAATDSFSTAIQGSLLEANPPTAELDSTSETKHTPTLKSLNSSTNTNSNENPFESSTHEGTGLNSRLSFEHFVVGKANQMAHAAAQHVAHNPGVSYNPFFLYGGVGLGKTHLVHAVGNTVLANNPNARIRYIHANQFIADVVGSYRRQTFDSFKRYYHGLDVLLIDDILCF
jgi:chromosomal replication initiator protein